MSYLSNFDRSFHEHTLAIVYEYKGEYEATLLINCLLGLLVLPKESFLEAIPEMEISKLDEWGISPSSIKCSGTQRSNDPNPNTLRGLVFNLRHAIAHFNIKPVPCEGEVKCFEFKNERGLWAVITVFELREFVIRLSKHMQDQ